MRVAVISNTRETKGLFRDSVLLDRLLTTWGHDVLVHDFRDVDRRDLWFSVVIHLEVIAPKALSWSDKHIYIPNCEWFLPMHARWVEAMRVVCAKTREGERVLVEAGVKRVVFTGFESEDRFSLGVPRERRLFHAWGGSIMKGTRSVLAAAGYGAMGSYPSSFLIGSKLPDAAFRIEQNRCRFWLQPSAVEGFGHCIHEGLSVGALVATLDAPPMREGTGIARLIPCRKVSRQHLADVYEARPEAIAAVAEEMWGLSDGEVERLAQEAREGYLLDRAEFRLRFRAVLEGL